MPAGCYEHLGAGGRVRQLEWFRCSTEETGWRYISRLSTPDGVDTGTVDVRLDGHGGLLRVAVEHRGWSLRGGRSGPELLWVRRPAQSLPTEAPEHRERAAGFTGLTPAFLVAAARLVPRDGDPVGLRLVALSDVLGTRRQDQRWRLTGVQVHSAGDATLEVSAYEVLDAETAERETVHIAGDVVLAASAFGLADLDSPPGSPLYMPE